MKVILLGAPGAGKGTHACFISGKIGVPPVSTGKLLREAVKNCTAQGLAAKELVEAGKLAPNEIVIEMLRERLEKDDCKNGYILDGFPRNMAQVHALEDMGIDIDLVIDIQTSDDQVAQRLGGRRVCEGCGTTYHLLSKPSAKGDVCEICDGKLIVREDDKPEIIRERLRIYHEQTQPLKEYYEKQGKLREVQSCDKVEDTAARVLAALGV